MTLHIDTLPLGMLETNCYVLRSGDDCWIIDPGMTPQPLIGFLRSESIRPSAILLTHGHGDHIAGVQDVITAFDNVKLICPSADADMLGDAQLNLSASFGMSVTAPQADELIAPGEQLTLGDTIWQVIDSSGHTPGGVSYYCAEEKIVITGDALFAGSIGRTDLPGASCGRLLKNIRENLLTLGDDVAVLPGHGPASSIGYERRVNPFVLSGRDSAESTD